MKKFLLKIFLFFITFLLLIFIFFSSIEEQLAQDNFYFKFTTPKQSSMIIGTSRALQGLIPEIINKELNIDIYNYAFTVMNSSYGPSYLKSIKKKLDKNSDDGIFILSVDPWCISTKFNPSDNLNLFRERDLFIHKLNFVNVNPNFEYLFKFSQTNDFYDLLNKNTTDPFAYLHKSGWLEIDIPMDSLNHIKRFNERIAHYNNNINLYTHSEIRISYLKKTIDYLNNYGKVYLVRLPVHPKMMEIENRFMKNFNKKIESIISDDVIYFDMNKSKNQYIYTDGNHLHKSSSAIVSKQISDLIKSRY